MKYLFIVITSLLVACNYNSKEKAATDNLPSLEKSIDSLFNNTLDINEPGATVLISYDGQMLIGKGYGLADLNEKRPLGSQSNMRMASVSKQFTALCIIDLEAKGLLSLDDSLTTYWPYPVFKDIIIHDLLNHTSGLADYEAYFMNKGDTSKIIENDDVLEWLSTNPAPTFAPNESWEYSNTAYLVLALLIEKISGQEFSEYAKEHVFEKANMQNTNFYSLANPIKIKDRAYCYEIDSLNQWKKVDGYFMNGVIGDGAVYTSVNDYFQFDNALRNNSFISKDLHFRIFEGERISIPKSSGYYNFFKTFHFVGKEVYYTKGWFRNEHIAFHTGSWFGTRTFVIHDLQRPLTIAVFLNSNLADKRNLLINETYLLTDNYLKKQLTTNKRY